MSSSPWRNGSGDVVGELAKAAKDARIGLGLYLSPWDRHEPCYGRTLDYNEFYMGQMTELLTRYFHLSSIWGKFIWFTNIFVLICLLVKPK